MSRRAWGTVHRLPSGMYRAMYHGPDLARHTAPMTFSARVDADAWLVAERKLIERDEWVSPKTRLEAARQASAAKGVTLREYSKRWLARTTIASTTKVTYDRQLRLRILPALGDVALEDLDRAKVGEWWLSLPLGSKRRACDLSYQVLRALCNSAIDDGLIEVQPCRVKGAGKPSERREVELPPAAKVWEVADAMPDRWRIAVLISAFSGLRSGEVRELRRKDIDLDKGIIRVRRAVRRAGSVLEVAAPKTKAGVRTVPIIRPLLGELRDHLRDYAQLREDGLLVYDLATGGHLHDSKFRTAYMRACAAAGVDYSQFVFHATRNFGMTEFANSGATTAELMAIAGHTTVTMAMRYQAVSRHMSEVADTMGERLARGRG